MGNPYAHIGTPANQRLSPAARKKWQSVYEDSIAAGKSVQDAEADADSLVGQMVGQRRSAIAAEAPWRAGASWAGAQQPGQETNPGQQQAAETAGTRKGADAVIHPESAEGIRALSRLWGLDPDKPLDYVERIRNQPGTQTREQFNEGLKVAPFQMPDFSGPKPGEVGLGGKDWSKEPVPGKDQPLIDPNDPAFRVPTDEDIRRKVAENAAFRQQMAPSVLDVLANMDRGIAEARRAGALPGALWRARNRLHQQEPGPVSRAVALGALGRGPMRGQRSPFMPAANQAGPTEILPGDAQKVNQNPMEQLLPKGTGPQHLPLAQTLARPFTPDLEGTPGPRQPPQFGVGAHGPVDQSGFLDGQESKQDREPDLAAMIQERLRAARQPAAPGPDQQATRPPQYGLGANGPVTESGFLTPFQERTGPDIQRALWNARQGRHPFLGAAGGGPTLSSAISSQVPFSPGWGLASQWSVGQY